MQLSILIVSGILSIMGFVLLLEDVAERKGWHEYILDMCIIASGAAAFIWTTMNYAY